MLKTTLKILTACLLAAALLSTTGCFRSKPATFYSLEAADIEANQISSPTASVVIGPIDIPEYLSVPQIQTRRDGVVLKRDEFNRWAGPLQQMILESLSSRTNLELPNWGVAHTPVAARARYNYRVLMRITRFEASDEGQAVLQAQWIVVNKDGEQIGDLRQVNFRSPVSDIDDAEIVVKALDRCIGQLASGLANDLKAVHASAPPADDVQ